jgi:hypothetical protein
VTVAAAAVVVVVELVVVVEVFTVPRLQTTLLPVAVPQFPGLAVIEEIVEFVPLNVSVNITPATGSPVL